MLYQRLLDIILSVTLTATLLICVSAIESNISDGGHIYWVGLMTSLLGFGALINSLFNEIKESF
jgi:hypothetical protein